MATKKHVIATSLARVRVETDAGSRVRTFKRGTPFPENAVDGEFERLQALDAVAEEGVERPKKPLPYLGSRTTAAEVAPGEEGKQKAAMAAYQTSMGTAGGVGPGSAIEDLMRVRTGDLQTIATAFGVKVKDRATKQDLAQAIHDAGTEAPRAPQTTPTDAAADGVGEPKGDATTSDKGPDEDDDLSDVSKEDLQAEAEKRGLAKSGSKADLAERIREHDSGSS